MNYESQYDFTSGTLIYQEAKKKPADPFKHQAAMFMDRLDLWKKPNRTRKQPPPVEQLPLLE